MLKVVIIEDEPIAAKDLQETLLKADSNVEILTILDSVATATDWLSKNEADLILSDIQLGDGLSFDIFKNIDIKTPIILTTAYDQYAIRAFKENSIDYLLKPIDEEELKNALDKYREMIKDKVEFDMDAIINALKPEEKEQYQQRFIITLGDKILSIKEGDVAYFFSEDRYTYLVDKNGRQHIVNSNLGDLENSLNPKNFYRINRKFIISFNAIKNMVAYSKSRVKIELEPAPPRAMDVIVSVERSGAFKKWLNR